MQLKLNGTKGEEDSGSGGNYECTEQELADLYTACAVKRLLPQLESIYRQAYTDYKVDGVRECTWINISFEGPQKEAIKTALNCNS